VVVLVGLSFGLAAPALGSLIDRGNGLIYDQDLNITWLQDANLVATNPFGLMQSATEFPTPGQIGSTALMNWFTANTWIAGMNAANYKGFNDWRLPTTAQPDASCSGQTIQPLGTGCIGSEMGHLFNVDGITAATSGLFSNVQIGFYWSGTEVATFPDVAWGLVFDSGIQGGSFKIAVASAWAVHSGDVVASVPEPSTMLLMGTGLLVLILYVWRRERLHQS